MAVTSFDSVQLRRRQYEDEESAARATLRAQIAWLESALSLAEFDLWEAGETRPFSDVVPAAACARLLSFAELEDGRDRLVARLQRIGRATSERARSNIDARKHLDAMRANPGEHRYEIVHHAALGERSCGAYHVLPRAGILGMLFGWWCVKLSSGCP